MTTSELRAEREPYESLRCETRLHLRYGKILCRTLRSLFAVLALFLGVPTLHSEDSTVSASWSVPAETAFEKGDGAWGIRLDESRAAILYDRVLIEDDGPGIGSDAWWMKTDRAPVTDLIGNTQVKKILRVEHPEASAAYLYVPQTVRIEFNGHSINTVSNSFPSVPVAWIKSGDNEVVLSARADSSQHVKIALRSDIIRNAPDRAGWPQRSFQSPDGGKTWKQTEGEYMVRLHLVQHVANGRLISPVIDAGSSGKERPTLLGEFTFQEATVYAEADIPQGTRIEFQLRTGSSPSFEPGSWSDWQPNGSPFARQDRYLQWQALLTSTNPLATPKLRAVQVEAKLVRSPAPPWMRQVHLKDFHNEEIRTTSIPFAYEDPLNPQLVALRKKYKLDEVIAGAKTETEQMVRLRDWVAHQWKYAPPEENYPAWSADEILTRKCGFCVQYAIVLMQCAMSFGHQARFVFGYNPDTFDGGGHEVCEIWSDEFGKWIFYDVNQNWHLLERRTQVPMSMLQVHDLIMKTYYNDGPQSFVNHPSARKPSADLAICYGTNMLPTAPPEEFSRHFTNGLYTVPTRWFYIHYLARNDFLSHADPLPKTQGTHWDWSEYWCWEDLNLPKRWLYRNFTARRGDLDWTLNQVHFDLTATQERGVLKVQMCTFTPYFQTYLAKVDQGDWIETGRDFSWKLHLGKNSLQLRVRTTAGVLGKPSWANAEMEDGEKVGR